MAYLTVENLNKSIDSIHLLKDISFSAEKATITLIAGKNGSGKSLLLKCLKGLGWVGSEILSCEQGYVHSETASSAMRFVPVWRIETDAGTFHVSGITREVRQLVS